MVRIPHRQGELLIDEEQFVELHIGVEEAQSLSVALTQPTPQQLFPPRHPQSGSWETAQFVGQLWSQRVVVGTQATPACVVAKAGDDLAELFPAAS